MQKKIQSALISVFYKDGLEDIVKHLHRLGITIYSTGGTQKFIEQQGIPCVAVETLTSYPSILGGRVKTLHPKVFGGILARRELLEDMNQLNEYEIPEIDLVIVDLYPFEETVQATNEEQKIIEKIDIGGVSLIRAAGKNYMDVLVVASRDEYGDLLQVLAQQDGITNLDERRRFASRAFEHCAHYDVAIVSYFVTRETPGYFQASAAPSKVLRYGENPHQKGVFYGALDSYFQQLHGKELSYNNLVDIDAACQLVQEFKETTFAVIKHTNVCGLASRDSLLDAWTAALAGDSESAFGGVLVSNRIIDGQTAASIHEIFFEILVAPDFDPEALAVLAQKKNRILLKQLKPVAPAQVYKNICGGILVQDSDHGNYDTWTESSRPSTDREKADLAFANIACKHLKSNAIALVKDKQLVGKGCGQTSRVDALRQAIAKAQQFRFDLKGAVMSSDAFFPFDDCVTIAHKQGISAVIQPGGSIRDKDSIAFCQQHDMAMVITGKRHFKH